MNTQLEPEPSTRIRMVQLEKCLADMKLLNNDTTAILAGDMNIQEESELCFPSFGRELCSTRAKNSNRVAVKYWQGKLIKRSKHNFLRNTLKWIR